MNERWKTDDPIANFGRRNANRPLVQQQQQILLLLLRLVVFTNS